MVFLLVLSSCKMDSELYSVKLSDAQYLRRLSLDLRGKIPTVEEINSFNGSEGQTVAKINEYLVDDGFPVRIRHIFSDIYGTQTDIYFINAADFLVTDDVSFRKSIGQEPLRILSYVAEHDLPWSTIVTADWTMANEALSAIFPVDYSGEDWQKVQYTDGRPSAGVLSTNGMWWRYGTTQTNANRLRANAISSILLCNNYLQHPIDFQRDSNLLDNDAIGEAIKNDPSCVNCHQTLDPLAAHLFGFWTFINDSWMENTFYHPDREQLHYNYLQSTPEYYGKPSENLRDLGINIAADPRFPNCTVQQLTSHLFQEEISMSDIDRTYYHREAFLKGDLNIKALLTSIVQDEQYKAGLLNDNPRSINAKLLRLDQLVSSIETLTDFKWTFNEYDMFDNDIIGLRSLAGGSDGRSAASVTTVPNATMLLVHATLSEQAAQYVLQQESPQEQSERRFFIHMDPNQNIEESIGAATQQIIHLHLIVLSANVSKDGPEVEAAQNLWNAVFAINQDPEEAWAAVLTAILRDPNYLLY